jgi:hypothetical protein
MLTAGFTRKGFRGNTTFVYEINDSGRDDLPRLPGQYSILVSNITITQQDSWQLFKDINSLKNL